jgi:prolyl-tRNA editing enzyme YbaK/EbsC (Cys-tRNA(Pro) deacylase)
LPELHPTALRFRDRARDVGLDVDVRELSASTRTAAEAAEAVGCELGQIVKSVILVDGDEPLLCLCAGDRRVAIDRLGEDVRMARANEVRDITGYAIGGVPPLGHDRPIRTLADRSLTRFDVVWCAAGTPNALFGAPLDDLLAAIDGVEIADIGAE